LKFIISLVIIFFLFNTQKIYCEEINQEINQEINLENKISDLDNILDDFNFDEINSVINSDSISKRINLKDLAFDIILGRFKFHELINFARDMFLKELFDNASIIRNLLLLIILSSIIKILSDSFESKSITEIAFYISYIMIINELFMSFRISVQIAQSLLQKIINIIQASMPLVMALVTLNGNISANAIFDPVIFLFSDIIILIINFMLPVIIMFLVVQVINNLTGKNLIANFADLIKNFISWSLKIISMSFMALLSLQRITAPLLESLTLRTAKFAINSVPVVGEVFSGAVDSLMTWAHVIKNGTLVALVVSIFFLCIAPIIKLAIFILIYKLIGALVQPICDERIVNCTEAVASSCILLLSCSFTVVIIFLFSVMIFISF